MRFRAPVGWTDFAQIRRQGLAYVDKSAFIVELLADTSLVLLLPRPRRFGKSTNISMLRCFFERPRDGADLSDLFQDLTVWGSTAAREHFQRYPVLAISLKEIKGGDWGSAEADLGQIIGAMAREHRWLLEHPSLHVEERADLRALLEGSAPANLLRRSLRFLSELLHRATGEPALILIDEYDTPICAGWLGGYYRESVDFFRGFLGAGLKDNPHLWRGVLTGILRVSKESIFSDMNHLAVYSLLREEYSQVFGFTEGEVRALAEAAGAADQLEEMRAWYNGYRCGSTTLYNPWSILNFLASVDRVPRPYWVNTSSNELIGRLITSGGERFSQELTVLLSGVTLRRSVDEAVVLPDLDRDAEAVWSLLLFSGYLKPVEIGRDGRELTLAVPNREVLLAYDTLLRRWLRGHAPSGEIEGLLEAMLAGDAELFEDAFGELVLSALSFPDTGGRHPERVYHAFTLGLLAQLRATHRVESERESGLGRADVLVIPRAPGGVGVVLEFKRLRRGETPEMALEAALRQIEERRYAARLEDAGAIAVRTYAVVFDGKQVRVRAG